MSSRTALLLLALTGCATVPTTGAFRNPAFTQGQAPGPAVALDLVSCHLSGVPTQTQPPHGTASEGLFRALGTEPIEVGEILSGRICAALSSDRALYEDLLSGSDWSAGAELAPLLRPIAQRSSAGSVLVSLTRAHAGCQPEESFFGEGDPLGPGRVGEPPRCGDDVRVDVGLFLFSAEGTLLWKSSGTSGTPAAQDLLPVMDQAARGIPVHFEPAPGQFPHF